ncbi:uncharacterized protein LOC114969803 isoform X4 [Acropora millepora]|uniref:uncharacterized protein LOC114969803 isoform X4 n=1 Tax=Acropora millepora TaxID=45264 RepID=UPI001CF4E9BB|nr:uncharacterized protein LOC114969803 isoform X4 [Acropora millepora]
MINQRKMPFCNLQVQEVPQQKFQGCNLFAGPILRVRCTSRATFLKPVTIKLPVSLGNKLVNVPQPSECRVRVFFLNSERETKEWIEISDELENPANYDGKLVTFKVQRFSGYTCLLDGTNDGSDVDALGISAHMSSNISQQPLKATFFAYFDPKKRLGSRDILFLICCPAHQIKDVRQKLENESLTLSEATSREFLTHQDKAFVFVSGGIDFARSKDKGDFFLRFDGSMPHMAELEVCLTSNQEYCTVEFRDSPNTTGNSNLLSTLNLNWSSPSTGGQGSSFPGTSGSLSQEATEGCTSLVSRRKLKVTLLGSEWGSTKGGLSTLNRELAIQLAKNTNVEVSMYLPQCTEEDKRAAAKFRVNLRKAEKKPGSDPVEWLASAPRDHCMDIVIGHGIHLGRQVPWIKELRPNCKWIQVVHTVPEELAMSKDYPCPIGKGAKKHEAEVELCESADQVVAVGPKLAEVFACSLRPSGKDQNVITLTPGIFSEFANITQAAVEGEIFRVLVFGRGDREDFRVKGYDIAARAFVELKDEEHSFKLVFVGAPDGEEDEVKKRFMDEGILSSQLIVRGAKDREQLAKQFFQADLVIMPSRTEGFGLAALEALSAGLPVLVSDNSGIGKALKKVPNGSNCVVNNEDPVKWAEAIKAVCRKERKVRLEEAILLRQKYAETYQWEGQCSKLVEKMCEMIKGVDHGTLDQGASLLTSNRLSSAMDSQSRIKESRGKRPLDTSVTTTPERKRQNRDIPEKIKRKGPSHPNVTTTERRQRQNASILEKNRGKRPLHPFQSTTPERQRQNADIPETDSDISVVVTLLEREYNRRAEFRPLLWSKGTKLQLEKVYTRLRLVSRHKAESSEIGEDDIFGSSEKDNDPLVLVEGSPGIGKSTFCLKLAHDWANGERSRNFPIFKLVFLLKCRDMKGGIVEDIFEQLLPEDLKEKTKEVLVNFLGDLNNQKQILIILDGLDELPEKLEDRVNKVLRRKIMSLCYVLATTRQEKGIHTREQFQFDTCLAIEGFSEGNSFEYIRKHFRNIGTEHSSKGERLIEEIKQNPLLGDLQSNPLNLLLLCVVYEDHEGSLPSSITDLYQTIVRCLLRRYCAKEELKASEKDEDLDKQFEIAILALGELAWKCLLNDRLSFYEDELEELERSNENIVARRLGLVYKEESLKRLKPRHAYSFLHKTFQEYLAASYIAHNVRESVFRMPKQVNSGKVTVKFRKVFLFVCGILREEASILFTQIGGTLQKDWDWSQCSREAASFFTESWKESGNAERMANTLCSFLPFPRVLHVSKDHFKELIIVLEACAGFSTVKTPAEVHVEVPGFQVVKNIQRVLAEVPNVKTLILPAVEGNSIDRAEVGEVLRASKTLKKVTFTLSAERGEGWASTLDVGFGADSSLSSVGLTIDGMLIESALQDVGTLLFNKFLSTLSITICGDVQVSLVKTLARGLEGKAAVKFLDFCVNGNLSFDGAYLLEDGILRNGSLRNVKVPVNGELPLNWQAVGENLQAKLTKKGVASSIYPNNFSIVKGSQVTCLNRLLLPKTDLMKQNVTLNVWGELSGDASEAVREVLCNCPVSHLTLNIHGQLTDEILRCTARYDKEQEKPSSITINSWAQMTEKEKNLINELGLDKNPSVSLNVCETGAPLKESSDSEVISSDEPSSVFAFFEEAENVSSEKEKDLINERGLDKNPSLSLNVCGTGAPLKESSESEVSSSVKPSSLFAPFEEAENVSSKSLSLTMTLTRQDSHYQLGLDLKKVTSLNSLTLTLNIYSDKDKLWAYDLGMALAKSTSLNSLTLTIDIYSGKNSLSTYSLYKTLTESTSLNSLTLAVNIYGDTDIAWTYLLDETLSKCTSLSSLTLEINIYGDIDSDCQRERKELNDLPMIKCLTECNFTFNICGKCKPQSLVKIVEK